MLARCDAEFVAPWPWLGTDRIVGRVTRALGRTLINLRLGNFINTIGNLLARFCINPVNFPQNVENVVAAGLAAFFPRIGDTG